MKLAYYLIFFFILIISACTHEKVNVQKENVPVLSRATPPERPDLPRHGDYPAYPNQIYGFLSEKDTCISHIFVELMDESNGRPRKYVTNVIEKFGVGTLIWRLPNSQYVEGYYCNVTSVWENQWVTVDLNAVTYLSIAVTRLEKAQTIVLALLHINMVLELLSIKDDLLVVMPDYEIAPFFEALDKQNFFQISYFYNKYCYNDSQVGIDLITSYVNTIVPILYQFSKHKISKPICTAICWFTLKDTYILENGIWKEAEAEGWEQMSEDKKRSLDTKYSEYYNQWHYVDF